MHYGGPIDSDMVVIVELEEFLSLKLRAIVRDYGVWYSKAVDHVEEKFHGLLGLDRRNRLSLDPLRELVNGDKQVRVTPRRFPEGADQIEYLDCERPCDGDCLECLSRQVGPPSVVLAPFAGAHDPLSISDHRRLVKSPAEGVPNQHARRDVLTTDSVMYVLH
jgi:hypothetical protein